MLVVTRFRPKKIYTVLVSFILLLLAFSLIFFFEKTENNYEIPPFSKHELYSQQTNEFLHLDEILKQPVPNTTHLRFHQNSAKPCSYNPPTLLAIVHSSPTHVLYRKAIRNTWGSSADMVIRTLFIVGRSFQPKIWQRVIQEAIDHEDIILVDMIDSYGNLTLKHIIGIQWILKNCPKASYVLKADDDAFIDMHRVENLVMPNLPLHAIACRIVPAGSPPRRSGKWKVTRQEYPFDDYPEYCSGLAYFTRPFTLKSINKAIVSGKVPYLWIDDLFVTGFSAAYAGVKRMDLSVWFARTEEQIIQWLTNRTSDHPLPWMVAEMTPRHWPLDAIAIWNKTKTAKKHLKP